MTAAEQEIIQPAVAELLMVKNLIETLVPCITSLFLGPWSDVNGRLPLFLSAISGIKFYYNYIFTIILNIIILIFRDDNF